MTRLMALVGGALLIAGLVVGFALPVHSGDYDCGSAFIESDDLKSNEFADTLTGGDGQSDCDSARSSARTLPVVLLVLGGMALLGAPFVERRSPSPDTA